MDVLGDMCYGWWAVVVAVVVDAAVAVVAVVAARCAAWTWTAGKKRVWWYGTCWEWRG